MANNCETPDVAETPDKFTSPDRPSGGFFEVHPVKMALMDLGQLIPGLPCGDPRATCSNIGCPGGRCVELGDEVKARLAEALGVSEIPCFECDDYDCTDGACLEGYKE